MSFLGAGGHEIQIDCPKVSQLAASLQTSPSAPTAHMTLTWAEQDTYILEAGLQNDVELPYTCRGGICGYVLPPLYMLT